VLQRNRQRAAALNTALAPVRADTRTEKFPQRWMI